MARLIHSADLRASAPPVNAPSPTHDGGMRWDLWRRRLRQRLVTDPLLRSRGRPVPTRGERRAARVRVAQGLAGALDGGKQQRDFCLARGYCCRTGCRYCPWGFDPTTRRFR